jgi:hypothetical protein
VRARAQRLAPGAPLCGGKAGRGEVRGRALPAARARAPASARLAQTKSRNLNPPPSPPPSPIKPRRSTYKFTFGPGPCSTCSSGTTTPAGRRGAVAASECSSCKPGYGGWNPGTTGAASCGICGGGGNYGVGYLAGGPACALCPQPANYTGKMQAMMGASDPSQCFGEFTSDGPDRGQLEWDHVPMEAAALTAQTGAAENGSAAGCQAACSISQDCQARRAPSEGPPRTNGRRLGPARRRRARRRRLRRPPAAARSGAARGARRRRLAPLCVLQCKTIFPNPKP